MTNDNCRREVFACGVTFFSDMDKDNPSALEVFNTIEDLKAMAPCWRDCGIVRLELSLSEWAYPEGPKKERIPPGQVPHALEGLEKEEV